MKKIKCASCKKDVTKEEFRKIIVHKATIEDVKQEAYSDCIFDIFMCKDCYRFIFQIR